MIGARDVARSKRWRRALVTALRHRDLAAALVSPRLPRYFDKAGRPEGARTTEVVERVELLHKFLIWIGRPDLSVSKLVKLLHTRRTGLDFDGEQFRMQIITAYGEKTARTLQRDIAILRREIWGDVTPSQLKAWGRSIGDGALLRGREEPKKKTSTEWEKARVSKSTWYRRQHRRP